MKITADTNVLLRAALRDDEVQAQSADAILLSAQRVAVSIQSLCEFVWVARRLYGLGNTDIVRSLEGLLSAPNLVLHRQAAEAGLQRLRGGGDFADGVIAHEGRSLGGEIFVSFDRHAVRLTEKDGFPAQAL